VGVAGGLASPVDAGILGGFEEDVHAARMLRSTSRVEGKTGCVL
jgi:hypothetical protein